MAEQKKVLSKAVKQSPQQREYVENVVRMRQIENEATNVQNNLMALERALMETSTTLMALNSMKDLTSVKESQIPLGSGVFADGTLKKSDKVLLDIGAGVVVERSVKDTIAFMKEREENIKKNLIDFQNILTNLERSYSEAGQRVQELQKGV